VTEKKKKDVLLRPTPVFVIDHDVVRFDVPVHDAQAVAVVQSLQELVQVETDVVIGKRLEWIENGSASKVRQST
jgi:hypothetical protein